MCTIFYFNSINSNILLLKESIKIPKIKIPPQNINVSQYRSATTLKFPDPNAYEANAKKPEPMLVIATVLTISNSNVAEPMAAICSL